MKFIKIISILLIIYSCGSNPDIYDSRTDNRKIYEIERKILELQGTASQITNIINSDYKTCPSTGDTSDALIRKICQVAQASTIEMQIEITSKLFDFIDELTGQIDAINDNLAQLQTSDENFQSAIDNINGSINTINNTLSSLDTRITNAESAISALESMTSGINSAVNGAMEAIEIGTENLLAGPFYESILRKIDKTRINAYVEVNENWQALSNNPVSAVNRSSIVTITLNSHGYLSGDIIELSDLIGGKGFSNGDIKGKFQIISATTNNFTIQLNRSATNNGSFGSSFGVVRKIVGSGLGTIWMISDGADTSARQTTLGKTYNFIIKSNGLICYDTTDRNSSFATIAAEGSNIICK